MWWMLPAGLAAGGAYQGEQNRQQNKRDAAAQAEIARWSPWTGMSPHQISHKDSAIGGAMQGGLAGMGAIAGKDAGGAKVAPASASLATPEQQADLAGPMDSMSPSDPYERPRGAMYGDNPNGFSLGIKRGR